MGKREELLQAIQTATELLKRKAKNSFRHYVLYSKPGYSMTWFHAHICTMLDLFAEGKIKKMMILVPPQHGKSELATRQFPAYLLGRNPNLKIGIACYAAGIAMSFNRQIQRNIDCEVYGELFPDTKLNYSKIFKTRVENFSRNTEKFEIINYSGFVKTVGRGGALTSETIDVGIIDDLYKDRQEATSPAVSKSAWDWYVDVFRTRLHNDSQELIMNTRWDEFDLCGRLLKEEPDEWVVIKFPAIKTKDISEYDHRKKGEALWPERHSIEKIMKVKKLNEVTFNSLYQQDPKPNTKLMVFPNWIETPVFPTNVDTIYWGLDFGKTTGINALVKHTRLENKRYFDECLYEPGLSAKAIAEILWNEGYIEGQPVFCDHQPTKISALRALGISAFPALKGEGSIMLGIDKLNETENYYTARSKNIRMELGKYQYVTYGSIITRIPVDEWNHLMDSCRYAAVNPHNFRKKD